MSSRSNHEEALGPHQGGRVVEGGAPLGRARAAMILVHGRGASAESILDLADLFAQPDVAYLAPQAAGHTWYPFSFLAPLERNEPGLSSGLRAVGDVLARVEAAGLPAEKTVVLGFSQGACLALEFAARHPRRYGGVVALSGGLIGTGGQAGAPPDDKRFDYEGSLDGTPVFLGCSDVDPHIPLARVRRSAEVLTALGGDVTERIYPGMGH
ncbi:MAG TPA: alpha/beta fold hydrolase, partial [Rhodothermales bacterium]|nr:alpha/beta fold hydrolase [Rhodothermales bacterium]